MDVSRLVWREWRGGLPTGIDRVAQSYVEHFGPRAQAVIQRRGVHFVLSPSDSDRLFEALLLRRASRLGLAVILARAIAAALGAKPRPQAVYLNVGHTGLNEPSLPDWIRRHRLRAVFLVHDLIPLTHPEYCREGEGEKHRMRMVNVLDSAAGVIGNSQQTLDDLACFAEQTGRPLPSSIVAWISGSQFPSQLEPKRLRRPYFVVVGTIEGRKNHQILLDVWRAIIAEQGAGAPILVIIGQRGWQADEIAAQLDNLTDLDGHVIELGSCSDEDLAAWIAGARALLMPSFIEGFGLPVLESLELGTPVIASDLPVYREIAGNVPTYLDPLDRDGWKRTIKAFSGDDEERKRQLVAALRFPAPTWAEHFRKVEKWLPTI